MKITGEMHFAKALDSLKAAGVEITALEPGELYALAEASRRCANPFSEVNAELADRPVRVCDGVWLWPPTAGAIVWLETYAAEWWGRGSARWRWAQVYALMHARERDAFSRLTSRAKAGAAVLWCALRLPISGAELVAAIRRAYGADEVPMAPEEKESHVNFAAMVARLEAVSGIPRETWLWQRSYDYLLKAYTAMHDFAAAYATNGKHRESMRDELDEAMSAMARTRAAIVRRVEESAAGKADADGGKRNDEDDEADGDVAGGAAAAGGFVGEKHSAGHAHQEVVAGEGDVGGGGGVVGVVHDGADYSRIGGGNQ